MQSRLGRHRSKIHIRRVIQPLVKKLWLSLGRYTRINNVLRAPQSGGQELKVQHSADGGVEGLVVGEHDVPRIPPVGIWGSCTMGCRQGCLKGDSGRLKRNVRVGRVPCL